MHMWYKCHVSWYEAASLCPINDVVLVRLQLASEDITPCANEWIRCNASTIRRNHNAHITSRASCHGTTCGRTARNSTLSEVLVFHQMLSTPKVSYIGRFHRAHPKEEVEQSMFFTQDPIMRMSLQYLVHFIQQEFLEIHYYNTKFRVRNLNSGITINI